MWRKGVPATCPVTGLRHPAGHGKLHMRNSGPRAAAVLLAAALTLAGCQAADAVINNSTLNVQTQMSETIFLDEVPPSLKTIYVSVRNTSDRPDVDFRAPLMMS